MESVVFGVMADLHVDIMHDAYQRQQEFLQHCEASKVDFIVSLGDYCNPVATDGADKERKEKILTEFWDFSAPSYHVLGNHDLDYLSKQEAVNFFKMPAPNYSFDQGGWHFVVLDANFFWEDGSYQPYHYGNYYGKDTLGLPSHVLEWLADDLVESGLPTVIFSHQSLTSEPFGISNYHEFREVLAAAGNVKLCINGHNHVDDLSLAEGVYYLNLNSISNHWLGEEYKSPRYGEELESQYPMLPFTAPFEDPLFAIITVHQEGIDICGRESRYVGLSPYQLRYPFHILHHELTPRIGSHYIALE